MHGLVMAGLIATLTLASLVGCDEGEDPAVEEQERGRSQRPDQRPLHDGDNDLDDEDRDDIDHEDVEVDQDQGAASGSGDPQRPSAPPRTVVPDQLVGTWENGSIDLTLWENYRQGTYAGRNAVPSREMMSFTKNGAAKFYRYEFAFGLYEELIDCEGTVAFSSDGTFTFYPVKGRKRFYDSRNRERSVDRPLNAAELTSAELAGKRAFALDPTDAAVIQITVPSSAPYNWYKKP